MQLIFLKVLKICESKSSIENSSANKNQINESFSIKKPIDVNENKALSDDEERELKDLLNDYNESISYLIESFLIKEACVYLNFFLDLIKDYPIIFDKNALQAISQKLHSTKKLL